MHLPGMVGVIPDELAAELAWASSRPTSNANPENPHAEKYWSDGATKTEWELALNEMETRFLEQYRRAWPGSAFQLNQNPSSGHGHHASNHALFTLISQLWLDLE